MATITPTVKKKKPNGDAAGQGILTAGTKQVAQNVNAYAPKPKAAPKTIEQPVSSIPSADPTAGPTFVPQLNIKIAKQPGGNISYQVGDKPEGVFNLTPEEYKAYSDQLAGRNRDIEITPNLKALIDYENAATSLNQMEILAGDPGATIDPKSGALIRSSQSPEEQMLLNRMTAGKQQEEIDKYAEFIKEQQAIAPTPIDKMGTPLQRLTFGATGAASGAGLTATGISAGAAAIGAGGAVAAAPIALAAAGGFIGAEIALSKAARTQNIALAKNQAKESAAAINGLIDEASKAVTEQDKQDMIAAFENRRREIKSAKAVLTDKSFMDTNFWVDKGGDELYDIEVWEEQEARIVTDFYNNLFPQLGGTPIAGSNFVPGNEPEVQA